MELKASNFTPHQRDILLRLWKRGPEVDLKEFGSPTAVAHLIRKGAVEVVRTEIGPRGGEYKIVALTPEGVRLADYISINGLRTWR